MNKTIDKKLLDAKDNIVIFYPHIGKSALAKTSNTLLSRWIGQGPRVDEFEQMFQDKFCPDRYPVAVNSGTSALHLAYILAGIRPGDKVIVPVFTCTATSIPLLWIGARPVFADINTNDMNISADHVRSLMNPEVKAIVCVHYGGLPCDMSELKEIADYWNVPLIEDCAQSLGAKYKGRTISGDYSCFSFQATKHITTGDGGMLLVKNEDKSKKAKRLRWFGIDREKKQGGVWDNDITEVGYKYQMTDVCASIGLAGLREYDEVLNKRKQLFLTYVEQLKKDVFIVGGRPDEYKENACWLFTIWVDKREDLQKKLREHKIESGSIHSRNDQYTIFEGKKLNLPNMNRKEHEYLVLPLHTHMTVNDVIKVCSVIKSGW